MNINMDTQNFTNNGPFLEVRKDIIKGSRRISNYFWLLFLYLSGFDFLLTGSSSYFHKNIVSFIEASTIAFIPQGILMMFYGTLAILIGTFLLSFVIWDIGSGYNEFNKVEQVVRVVRNGFPGENRGIFMSYPFEDITSIDLEIAEAINPKRIIFLCTYDERRIPLTPASEEPLPLATIEKQATSLAEFLGVRLNIIEVKF